MLEAVKRQLKTYRQAVLKYAFEGKLTEAWRQENPQPPASELLEQIKAERQRQYEQALEDWEEAVKEWEKEGPPTPGSGGRRKKLGKPRVSSSPKPQPV